MGPTGFFLEFIVAAGIGALIGIEREHRADGQDVIAGVRTFPLIAISGFLAGVLARSQAQPLILASVALGAFAFAIAFMLMRTRVNQMGATTPITMIVTFFLGALVAYDYTFEAVVVGVVATFLLVTKRRLHRFAKVLDDDEILSTLQFITVSFILLPLTYNMTPKDTGLAWLGRGALIDPFVIVLLVVFVSTMSFVSLLAMRQVGPSRGIELTGLLGGFVNSEATTAGLAQRARDEPAIAPAALVAIIFASVTMILRHLMIAAFADPTFGFAKSLVPYLAPIAIVGLVVAWRHRRVVDVTVPFVRIKNPFAVMPALRFGLLYAAVSVVAGVAATSVGPAGVYVTALGGFVSAGAVIGSIAALQASHSIALDVAVRTALLAVAASILGKLVILRAVNPSLYQRSRAPFLVMGGVSLVGALVAFFV